MNDVSCILLSYLYKKDEDGNVLKDKNGREIKEVVKKVVPIIKIEDIWAKEFYFAREKGSKPSLRIVVSSLNYEFEEELMYMGQKYSVIRSEGPGDEKILVCERKTGDG